MPLEYGQVDIAGVILTVEPYEWPPAVLRTAIHETATGRLVEIDPTVRVQDVDLVLEGTERTGWLGMTDTQRAAIITQWQAGITRLIQDWRGNSGTFFYSAQPEFRPVATDDTQSPPGTYWAFMLRFIRVS